MTKKVEQLEVDPTENESTSEKLREALSSPPPEIVFPKKRLLGFGSTLLNLAVSNDWRGAIEPGTYIRFIGDSNSGKSWLLHTLLAEAANNPEYDKYRLIYDDVENGAMMDIERYFGAKLAARKEPPKRDAKGFPVHSAFVEDFYRYLDDACKSGRPFIYALDSMDALDSLSAEKLFDENKAIIEKSERSDADADVKLKANYGDGKAKYNSQNIRRYVSKLRDTGSILLIVTQTRDNITGYGEAKVAGGGHALKYYSHVELWTKPVSNLKKTVNGKERQIGTMVSATVKKNRVAGQRPDVTFPIYNSYGIDDLGSCIDYLLEEKVITQPKGSLSIEIPQWEWKGKKDTLINRIEEEGKEDDLRQLVADTWNGILEKTAIQRKKRYE